MPRDLQGRTYDQRQTGIVHVARLAHEGQPQVDVFFSQNLHGLIDFFEDDFAIGHGWLLKGELGDR
jgi:hypothetical protein